eukprot:1606359-Rhodomonas_salina.1
MQCVVLILELVELAQAAARRSVAISCILVSNTKWRSTSAPTDYAATKIGLAAQTRMHMRSIGAYKRCGVDGRMPPVQV